MSRTSSRASRISRLSIGLLCAFLSAAAPAFASTPRQLYQTNSSGGTLAALTINPSTGALTANGSPVATGSGYNPNGVVVSPDGKFVFVANAGIDEVSIFSVAADGTLTKDGDSASIAGMQDLFSLTMSNDGTHLYAVGATSSTSAGDALVQAFTFDPTAKTLTALGSTVDTGATAYNYNSDMDIVLTPDNKQLYVSTSQVGTTGEAVVHFPILATGALDTANRSTVRIVGGQPYGLSVSPDGTHLYVGETNASTPAGSTIDNYMINSDGTLAANPQLVLPDPTAGDPTAPYGIEVSRDGKHLYVSNVNNGTQSNIAELPITNGSLGSPVIQANSQRCPLSLAITPDDKFAYTGNYAGCGGTNPSVNEFTIQAAGGFAAQSATVATGSPAFNALAASPRQAPTAAFSSTPAAAGSSSTFDGSGSSDPDASGTIARYDWSWGDTTTTSNGGATPSHTYATSGNFTVSLTVTNDAGCSTTTITTGHTVYCNGSTTATIQHQIFVDKASPTLTTTPSAGGAVGSSVNDVAHLSGTSSPDGTGSVSFKLYAASDSTCTGTPTPTSLSATPSSVSADGDYTSQSTTPASPGTYHWIATFSGDANNSTVSSQCSDETVTITKASPTLTTTPSAGGPVGSAVHDVAHLSGTSSPDGTGNVSFKLYAASDSTCTGTPAPTSLSATPSSVSADGDYTSQSTTPASPGTYHWIATFSGDANNNSVSSNCSDETVTITTGSPTLTTTPSAGGTVGTSVTDVAHLSGTTSPDGSGSVSFKLYGAGDSTCSGSATSLAGTPSSVSADGNFTSASTTPAGPGTYHWIATFSGDANNSSVSSNCSDETVTITKASPTLTTHASGGVGPGGHVTDTATLANGVNPTGTITFKLYGPNDATCTGTPVSSTKTVNAGNGDYTSDPASPSSPGTYRWRASYAPADGNNNAVATACNDTNESVTVTAGKSNPTITTHASAGVKVGGKVSDTATLAGGSSPTGTITFKLYGPNDATCSSTPVSSSKTVSGNGDYTSSSVMPSTAGTYRWTASYSGDAKNGAAAGACNAANESVNVTSKPGQHPPAAHTTAATALTKTSATLNGTVNPNGQPTTYHFQYGRTNAYGKSTTSRSAGSGSSTKAFSASIGGLKPATTYHFRIVAANSAGITPGGDRTFTTSAKKPPPPPPAHAKINVDGLPNFCLDPDNDGDDVITLHIKIRDSLPMRVVYVRLDGRKIKTAHSKKFDAAINLNGLAIGTHKIEISLTDQAGRHAKRTLKLKLSECANAISPDRPSLNIF